jgi:hypothetical protein
VREFRIKPLAELGRESQMDEEHHEEEPPTWTREAEPFNVPVPPGFLPPFGDEAGEPRDIFFLRHTAPPPGPAGREAEDIMLRRVPSDIARRFRAAAGGRGLTHAQYLAALVGLHDAMRGLADAGAHESVSAELERLGLATVEV